MAFNIEHALHYGGELSHALKAYGLTAPDM